MVLCCVFFFFSFFKDWICNKIEHCDVGMIFHSTLESRCRLEETKEEKSSLTGKTTLMWLVSVYHLTSKAYVLSVGTGNNDSLCS